MRGVFINIPYLTLPWLLKDLLETRRLGIPVPGPADPRYGSVPPRMSSLIGLAWSCLTLGPLACMGPADATRAHKTSSSFLFHHHLLHHLHFFLPPRFYLTPTAARCIPTSTVAITTAPVFNTHNQVIPPPQTTCVTHSLPSSPLLASHAPTLQAATL